MVDYLVYKNALAKYAPIHPPLNSIQPSFPRPFYLWNARRFVSVKLRDLQIPQDFTLQFTPCSGVEKYHIF